MSQSSECGQHTKELSRHDLTGPALRTFFNIAGEWKLSEVEQLRLLGLDSRSTLQSWKRGSVRALSHDTLDRVSYIFGIYQALHILLPTTANDWVRKPNAVAIFNGSSALERMLSGKMVDLAIVRNYLDSQSGQT
jgi:Protein of unknown function (DUF2384)